MASSNGPQLDTPGKPPLFVKAERSPGGPRQGPHLRDLPHELLRHLHRRESPFLEPRKAKPWDRWRLAAARVPMFGAKRGDPLLDPISFAGLMNAGPIKLVGVGRGGGGLPARVQPVSRRHILKRIS